MDKKLSFVNSPVVQVSVRSGRYVRYHSMNSAMFSSFNESAQKFRTPQIPVQLISSYQNTYAAPRLKAAILLSRPRRNGVSKNVEPNIKLQSTPGSCNTQMPIIKAKCLVNYKKSKDRLLNSRSIHCCHPELYDSEALISHNPGSRKRDLFPMEHDVVEAYKRVLKGSVHRLQTYLHNAELSRLQQYNP